MNDVIDTQVSTNPRCISVMEATCKMLQLLLIQMFCEQCDIYV